MAHFQWNQEKTLLSFETSQLLGDLVADDPDRGHPNHRVCIQSLRHKQSDALVTPGPNDQKAHAGTFSIHRICAQDSWLTDLRATSPRVKTTANGARFTWDPSFGHQVRTEATYAITEDAIDLTIEIQAFSNYRQYEMVVAAYHPSSHCGSAFLGDKEQPRQVSIIDSDLYHGMYPFFSRDLKAAAMLNDGRSNRGRWPYRAACLNPYALPLATAMDDRSQVSLMGLEADVAAVGVTYSAEPEHRDDVAQHHGLYLSLFGIDLNPGDGLRTVVRLAVGGADDSATASWLRFMDCHAKTSRRFEVTP